MIVSIIPARSGSKSLPHKNIRQIAGKPLIAHSILQSLNSKLIEKTIVSTDSLEYAAVAGLYGAPVEFLRPAGISGDLTTDLEVFQHVLDHLSKQNYVPDIIVHLRPTCPVRNVKDIEKAIRLLIDNPEADSVRSVYISPLTPFKMWHLTERNSNKWLTPVIKDKSLYDPWNQPRQVLPPIYVQTGDIDIIRTSTITKKGSMTGDKILAYEVSTFYDIDTEEDFIKAENYLSNLLY